MSIFGSSHVKSDKILTDASSIEWEVSDIVTLNDHVATFKAVGGSAVSVYTTSTAFHDLGSLDNPHILISVVRSKKALGARLVLLAQAGRVTEDGQPDDIFRRAVA